MGTLMLSNQASRTPAIEPQTKALADLLGERRSVWDRLPDEAKRKWLASGKDPVLALAWKTYQDLRAFFRGVDDAP